VNVVFLLLTAAAGTGGHPDPAPAPSCSTCGSGYGAVTSACDSDCCGKPSWRDRFMGMWSRKGGCGCEAAPAPCCAPAPTQCCTPAPEPCRGHSTGCECDPCASKHSWFDRWRGMFGHKGGDCCCQTASSGCCDGGFGAHGAPVAQPAPGAPVAQPAPAPGPHPTYVPPAQAPTGHTQYAPPGYQPQYAPVVQPPNGAPVVVNPQQGGQVIVNPAPNQGNVTTPQPLPQGGDKPAEQIQRQPNKEKNTKQDAPSREGASATPPAPVVSPAAAKVETEVKNPFDLDRRYDKRVTHAADYSKLTGQLFYVHADGGLWVLRYASLDVEDAKGGGVILARDRQMNNYREGDLVTVEGEVISDKGSSRLGGPLYRVRNIVLVDRQQ